MIKNHYLGKFIVFEGLDGSGQSTQANNLRVFFRNRGYPVILTKEPTENSLAGKKVRRILKKEIKAEPIELQKLFIEDRKDHLQNLIIPALKEGKYVIADRYFLSTCAFGGINVDMEKLIKLNKGIILPDITFFLNVSPKICIERIKKRGEKFEFFEKEEKLKQVREKYLSLRQRFENIYLIDGELSRREVFKQILEIIKKEKI